MPTKGCSSRIFQHAPIIGLVVVIGLLAAVGESATQTLSFDRDALHGGEWYRWLTGHLVHLGPLHAALNLFATVLCWLVFHKLLSPLQWLLATVISALSISTLLWISGIDDYVGFSAVIHSLVMLSIGLASDLGKVNRLILMAGLVGKVLYEQMYGSAFSDPTVLNGEVAVDSHLFGVMAGLILLVGFRIAGTIVMTRDAAQSRRQRLRPDCRLRPVGR